MSTMNVLFSSVQLLSHVGLFVTPWTAARQAFLSITNSQSLFKLMFCRAGQMGDCRSYCQTLTEGEFPDWNSGYLSLGKTNLYHCSKHSCPRFTYYASGWLHRGPLSCPLYLIRGGYLVTDTEENLIAFLITIAETQTGKANIQGPQNSEKGQLLGVMRKNH